MGLRLQAPGPGVRILPKPFSCVMPHQEAHDLIWRAVRFVLYTMHGEPRKLVPAGIVAASSPPQAPPPSQPISQEVQASTQQCPESPRRCDLRSRSRMYHIIRHGLFPNRLGQGTLPCWRRQCRCIQEPIRFRHRPSALRRQICPSHMFSDRGMQSSMLHFPKSPCQLRARSRMRWQPCQPKRCQCPCQEPCPPKCWR